MGILERLFSSTSESAAAPVPTIESALAKLAAAKQAREVCVSGLAEATAHLDRVRQILAAADAAAAALKLAESKAAAVAQAWAESGAVGEPSGDAMDAAVAARNAEMKARLKAEGARAAFPKLEAARETAESRLHAAENAIRYSSVGVLQVEAEQDFALLAELAPRVHAAVLRLRGLRILTGGAWGRAHSFFGYGTGAGNEIAARLKSLGFPEEAKLTEVLATRNTTAEHAAYMASATTWLRRAKELTAAPPHVNSP